MVGTLAASSSHRAIGTVNHWDQKSVRGKNSILILCINIRAKNLRKTVQIFFEKKFWNKSELEFGATSLTTILADTKDTKAIYAVLFHKLLLLLLVTYKKC